MINQAVDDHTIDNTLFAINSKRASPVEIASEAIEDVGAMCDLKSGGSGTPSAATPSATLPEPMTRDGIVRYSRF